MNTPQSIFQFFMSRIPQTNYLTPPTIVTTTPKAYIEQVAKEAFILNAVPQVQNNQGQTTGTRDPSDMWIESWSTEGGSYSFDVSSQNLGRHLLAALGGYSVAAVAGQAGAYKHTFTPLNVGTTQQLPAYSFVQQAAPGANAIDSIFPSMNLGSLKLSSAGAARVSGQADWRGSGEETLGSSVDFATNVLGVQGTQNFFNNAQSKILVSADTNSGNGFTTCDLTNWNLGITNSFNENDWGCPRFVVSGSPQSGALRSNLLLTGTQYEYDFTLKLRASDPAYAALKAQTPTSVVNSLIGETIGATTAKHQLDVTMPLTKYMAVTRQFTDGFAYTQIKPTLLFDRTSGYIMKVELTNDVASYIA